LAAIAAAQPFITKLCDAQLELRKIAGKEKLPVLTPTVDLSWIEPVRHYAYPLIKEASFVKGKMERYAALAKVQAEVREKFQDLIDEDSKRDGQLATLFEDLEYEILRSSILNDGKRTDGRKVDQIRPISCEVGVLERTHGSALFTRGETQALAVTTLGTASDEQMFDTIDGEKSYSSFMLHYNFPPYSVGECGKLSTGRREIGHGHLAQRALEAIVPTKESFPYTIRVVSEILESNGSSSMASVCGGCLSLMDAGVPIKKPVAGIAMGLITEGADYSKYVVLSDILGEEDHLGDMDFKVAGSRDGITAFQMDIKIAGVTPEIMKKALEQAKQGRMHILSIMEGALATSREEISEYAPKILTMKVDEEKIGAVIGTGGKTIKAIASQSGAEVNIADDGTVTIYGRNNASAQLAKELVKSIVEEPEVGRIYEGTVKRIMDFGAFIEILPGKEGLCHISKLAKTRVQNVEDVLKVGQVVPVKLIEIDRQNRLNLSYIDAIEAKSK
ncbi:MAG: polyribonucleotide nucleotidyltransferase, partial [Sphaerochaeta sp.]|nr:polyribonucleotide nucleotidyltransferase [Sphaerochaeta sp.]